MTRNYFFQIPSLLMLALIALNGCSTVDPRVPLPAIPKYVKKSPYSTIHHAPPENYANRPRPYQINGQWYQPLSHSHGFQQQGIASWYGRDFHGLKTSNGEVYDMFKVSAAHKTLPLGTYVRIYNRENGRSLVVRINDRGPFISGRIIDLSYESAKRLGILEKGTGYVEIFALAPSDGKAAHDTSANYPENYFYSGIYSIQVGAFSDPKKAKQLSRELEKRSMNPRIVPLKRNDFTLYRVVVGNYGTLDNAGKYESMMKQYGFNDAFVIAE